MGACISGCVHACVPTTWQKYLLCKHVDDIANCNNLVCPFYFLSLQKYNIITFLPLVLFQQFRFFLNLYFLIMALSQFIPDIRISYLYTYWGPLGFVLTVTICREAVDDFRRHQRDREVNSQKFRKCVGPDKPLQMVASSKLKVSLSSFFIFICPPA